VNITKKTLSLLAILAPTYFIRELYYFFYTQQIKQDYPQSPLKTNKINQNPHTRTLLQTRVKLLISHASQRLSYMPHQTKHDVTTVLK
jgi:hypothetical protein